MVEARFFTHGGSTAGPERATARQRSRPACACACAARGVAFSDLPLDRLCLHLRGADDMPVRIVRSTARQRRRRAGDAGRRGRPPGTACCRRSALQPLGFAESEALLPSGQRSFQGYRLLQEYFAFPQRFQFVELRGLQAGLRQCADKEIEITILLDRADAQLEKTLDSSNFALHCTPVVNLFQRRADRINVTGEQLEYHVLVDRTRPMDYEVFQVESVTGYGSGPGAEQAFKPFYSAKDIGALHQNKAFYQVRREQRTVSQRQRRDGPRSSYIGSEAFMSIVDAAEAPYSADLRQLGLSVWCTNRDLPLSMPLGRRQDRFHPRRRRAR